MAVIKVGNLPFNVTLVNGTSRGIATPKLAPFLKLQRGSNSKSKVQLISVLQYEIVVYPPLGCRSFDQTRLMHN